MSADLTRLTAAELSKKAGGRPVKDTGTRPLPPGTAVDTTAPGSRADLLKELDDLGL